MLINIVSDFLVFVFGLCIGSFLNCAVYRMEQEKTLQGRSFCPRCKHSLKWQDLVPVLSFLMLGGKCRYCKKKISWQYPIVEVATGLIFLLIFLLSQSACAKTLDCHVASLLAMTPWLAFMFYVAAVLIAIFIYDLKHYLIPDKILFPAIAIAFVYRVFDFSHFFNFVLAAVIASGFFLLIFLVSRGKGIGFGDVKLAILMGLLLGVPNIFAGLFLGFCFGAVIGVALMIFGKKGLKSEIPFGPFLITGTFVAMFWGDQMINWYFNFFKI